MERDIVLLVGCCRKDVRLPVQMQRVMAVEAEATREARAKVGMEMTRHNYRGSSAGECRTCHPESPGSNPPFATVSKFGHFRSLLLLLLAAPTWLWGRCGRHNSPPASSVMDLVFRRSDGSHVSIDTVHPSLLRSSSFSSPRWYHLQSLSSDVFLFSSLYVAKPPQSCFPAPLRGIFVLPTVEM